MSTDLFREMNSSPITSAASGHGRQQVRLGDLHPNTPVRDGYFGILKAGGVVVAIDSRYTAPEIVH
jgi:hypothetical protein